MYVVLVGHPVAPLNPGNGSASRRQARAQKVPWCTQAQSPRALRRWTPQTTGFSPTAGCSATKSLSKASGGVTTRRLGHARTSQTRPRLRRSARSPLQNSCTPDRPLAILHDVQIHEGREEHVLVGQQWKGSRPTVNHLDQRRDVVHPRERRAGPHAQTQQRIASTGHANTSRALT